MKNKKAIPAAPPEPSITWRVPAAGLALAFVVWASVVLYHYFQAFPAHLNQFFFLLEQFSQSRLIHPYAGHALGSIAVAAWLAWIAAETGFFLLKRLLPPFPSFPLERLVIASALGLAVISFLPLGAGVLGLWYPAVFWGVLGALTLALLLARRFAVEASAPALPEPPRAPWRTLWMYILAAFFLLYLYGDLTPEVFYDALFYHIAIPNLYKLNHRVFDVPTMISANFVLTVQMIYGVAITLANEIAAKLMHGWMGILLGLSYVAFGRRYLSPGAGLIAAILFGSMPMVGINVKTTGMEVANSFFQFIAAYTMVLAFSQPQKRWWVLAGLTTGIAASCKYTSFAVGPIAWLLLIWQRRANDKQPWGVVWRESLYFLVPAGLVLLPILVKNAVFHGGNPIYPFAGTFWGTPKIDPHTWALLVADSTRPPGWAAVTRIFTHPWAITMKGGSNADFVGPAYLLALPLVFLVRSRSLAFTTMRRYAGLMWLLWLGTMATPRYGMPALALMPPLFAECLVMLARLKFCRTLVLAILLMIALPNFYQLTLIIYTIGGWQVVGGLVDKDVYLSHMQPSYPTPPYAGIKWMNDNLAQGSKILYVGETRSYYTHHDVIVASAQEPQPIVTLANAASSGADLARQLRAHGVTHLFFNFAEAMRTEGYKIFPWSQSGWRAFSEFWAKYPDLIWRLEDNEQRNLTYLYVFRIKSDAEAEKPSRPLQNLLERWAPK